MELNQAEKEVMRSFLACYYDILKKADYNGDGMIEEKELLSFLLREGTDYGTAREAVRNVFKALDKNNDGKIVFEEVLQYRPR